MALIHFRSLSRWIGSYTRYASDSEIDKVLFPAPLEVDRFLYQSNDYIKNNFEELVSVPSRGE